MQPIFHIGLPRTGTTTLQRNLFSNQSLFAPVNEKSNQDYKFWRKGGIGVAVPESQVDIPAVQDDLLRIEQAYPGTRILMSDERLTSIGNTLSTQEMYARRIHEISPNAKIIITFRRQQGLMKSRYTQLKVRKIWGALGLVSPLGGAYAVDHERESRALMKALVVPDFVDWARIGASFQHYCWFGLLNYYDLYQTYARVFGKENVHPLFFEDLIQNRENFASGLAKFLEVPFDTVLAAISTVRHPSPKPTALNLWKHFARNLQSPGEGVDFRYALRMSLGLTKPASEKSSGLDSLVESYWGQQNMKLAELLGENLATRGYST